MRTIRLLFLSLLIFASSIASAENCFSVPCRKADLPTCVSRLKGKVFEVKNCVSATSCASTASPGFAVELICDTTDGGTTWAYRTSGPTDVSGYANLTGVASSSGQTIQGVSGSNKARVALDDTSGVVATGNGSDATKLVLGASTAFLRGPISSATQLTAGNGSIGGQAGSTSLFSGNSVRFGFLVPVEFPKVGTLPTCDSSLVPNGGIAIYFDSTTGSGSLCGCTGSAWFLIGPSGGSCV